MGTFDILQSSLDKCRILFTKEHLSQKDIIEMYQLLVKIASMTLAMGCDLEKCLSKEELNKIKHLALF
jgi:hypothetical protein